MRRILIVSSALLIVATVASLWVWQANSEIPLLRQAERSAVNLSIRVSPNVQVSSQFEQSDFEFCDVASDPRDATRLFASVLRWPG